MEKAANEATTKSRDEKRKTRRKLGGRCDMFRKNEVKKYYCVKKWKIELFITHKNFIKTKDYEPLVCVKKLRRSRFIHAVVVDGKATA